MRIPAQFKQTLIGTFWVGAILGAVPAPVLILFAFVGDGGENGPAIFFQFNPVFIGYAVAVFLGAIAMSTLLFGIVPWVIHQAIRLFVARRSGA